MRVMVCVLVRGSVRQEVGVAVALELFTLYASEIITSLFVVKAANEMTIYGVNKPVWLFWSGHQLTAVYTCRGTLMCIIWN